MARRLFGYTAFVAWFALRVDSMKRAHQEETRDAWWIIPFALAAITFIFLHLAQRPEGRTGETPGRAQTTCDLE
jgi:hypothetical protein